MFSLSNRLHEPSEILVFLGSEIDTNARSRSAICVLFLKPSFLAMKSPRANSTKRRMLNAVTTNFRLVTCRQGFSIKLQVARDRSIAKIKAAKVRIAPWWGESSFKNVRIGQCQRYSG